MSEPHFLWWNTIQLYGYTTFCLSIDQLIYLWVGSSFWLSWIMLLWTLMSKFWGWHMFSFILCVYIRVEFLVHKVLCFILWATTRVYWATIREVTPFYLPSSSVWGFQFFYVLANTCCYPSFNLSHSNVVWSGTSSLFWFVFPWWLTVFKISSCAY